MRHETRTGQEGVSDHAALLITEEGRWMRAKPRSLLIIGMHYRKVGAGRGRKVKGNKGRVREGGWLGGVQMNGRSKVVVHRGEETNID